MGETATDNVTVLLGNGSGSFTPSSASPIPNVSKIFASLQIFDANGDGLPDIFASDNSQNGLVNVFFGDGTGGFSTASKVTLSSGAQTDDAITADFNQDGWPDIAVIANASKTVYIWLNDHTGHFTLSSDSPILVAGAPTVLAAGDFNGDGIVDLGVIVTPSPFAANKQLVVLLGHGDGTFTGLAPNIPLDANPSRLFIGDRLGRVHLDHRRPAPLRASRRRLDRRTETETQSKGRQR